MIWTTRMCTSLRISAAVKEKWLTTSKLPGATIRLSMTLLIFVTRDKMEDYMQEETGKGVSVSDHKQHKNWWDWLLSSQCVCRLTCSAGVGLRSWFLFSKHSLKAVSSGAGFTLGKAISHLWQTKVYFSTHTTNQYFICCTRLFIPVEYYASERNKSH